MRSSTIIVGAAVTSFMVTLAITVAGGPLAFSGRIEPTAGAYPAAPTFSVRDLDGNAIHSEELDGAIVVLDFWATWCTPCLREIDDYNSLAHDYADAGVRIVAVTMQSGSAATVADFARQWDVRYPVVLGDEITAGRFGGLWGYPTTFLIDRQGRLRGAWSGAGGGKLTELRSLIDEVLAADSSMP